MEDASMEDSVAFEIDPKLAAEIGEAGRRACQALERLVSADHFKLPAKRPFLSLDVAPAVQESIRRMNETLAGLTPGLESALRGYKLPIGDSRTQPAAMRAFRLKPVESIQETNARWARTMEGIRPAVSASEFADLKRDVAATLRWAESVARSHAVQATGSALPSASETGSSKHAGSEPSDKLKQGKSGTRLKVVQALFLLEQNPDWSQNRIAKEVGISASTLSRDSAWQRAKKMTVRDRPHRGFRNAKTDQIDAFDGLDPDE